MDNEDNVLSKDMKIPKIVFPKDIFTFYLSHPLVSRKKIRAWEIGFENKHNKIALMNPFYDIEGEGREDIKYLDEGKDVFKDPGHNWRLVQRDTIAIAFSRGILGIVDENSDSSIGTLMEFVLARVMAKNPKLCICTNKNLFNHPWLNTFFHKIYPSFDAFESDVENQVERVKKKWGF